MAGSHDFPPSVRLRKQAEYDRVFEGGTRVYGKLLTLIGRRASSPGGKLGVSCGKRYSKHAVDRNRFRRFVREAYRQLEPRESDLDLVVLPRGRPGDARSASVAEELASLLRKLAGKLPSPP